MIVTFRSVHHPEGRPRGLVYARRLVGPIAACTLPVMIGATAGALQGYAVWGYLVWGLPLALGAATLWTHFVLSATVAEVRLRDGQCAVRSVHEVLTGRSPQWATLYGVREASVDIELYLGWTTYVCRRRDWPEFLDLRSAARSASQANTGQRPRPSQKPV